MFSARVPTLISDQLWDRFIEEHYGKTSRYLAPALSSAREPSDGSTNSASSDVSEKSETRHVSSERIRERGKRRNANSRKWKSFRICEMQRSKRRERGREMRSRTKRKKKTEILPSARRQRTDVYDRFNDIEFETDGKNHKRMSLSEFRRRRE